MAKVRAAQVTATKAKAAKAKEIAAATVVRAIEEEVAIAKATEEEATAV